MNPPSNRAIAEAATTQDAWARDVAISMRRQGKSAAEVWDALVSAGVEPNSAEALVKELLNLRRPVEIVPIPEPLDTSAFLDTPASPGLWFAAITAYMANVFVNMAIKPSQPSAAAQIGGFIGTLIGAFLGAIIVVGISNLWESNRNQRRRVMVFAIASAVWAMLPIVLIVAMVSARSH